MSTRVGTPYFMAPEVHFFLYSPHAHIRLAELIVCRWSSYVLQIFDGKYIGKACDLWGLGVITFILLSGHPPFDGNTKKETFSKVKDGNYCFSSPEWDDIR